MLYLDSPADSHFHLVWFPLEGATCSTIACKPHQKCLTHPVTARPHCVACDIPCSTAAYGNRAICGSDGHTYSNWCALQAESCRSSVVIETRHSGLCDQGENRALELRSDFIENMLVFSGTIGGYTNTLFFVVVDDRSQSYAFTLNDYRI